MSRIRQERVKRGWSLTDLTMRTGIPSSNLSLIERGLAPVWPSWRRRLCRVFGLSQTTLFGNQPGIADGTPKAD